MSEYCKSLMSICEVHNQTTLLLTHPNMVQLYYRNEIISVIGITKFNYFVHSAWAFERYRHSVQPPCTLSGAFEARVIHVS